MKTIPANETNINTATTSIAISAVCGVPLSSFSSSAGVSGSTGTSGSTVFSTTVIVVVASIFPDFTVTLAVPNPTAVTTPFSSIVATSSLSIDQTNSSSNSSVVSSGLSITPNCNVSPKTISGSCLSIAIESIGIMLTSTG